MTVIAYRAGQMAADSSCWQGDTNAHNMRKVHRIGGGLVGCAGRVDHIQAFIDWVRGPHLDLEDYEETFPAGDWEAIVVDPTGRVTTWNGVNTSCIKIAAPYCAIGSGQDFALGALHAGADAKGAVKAAIRHHALVRGPIRVYQLKRTT